MKICFILETIYSVGGIPRVATLIANGLAETHSVTLCVFCDKKHGLSPYGLSEQVQVEYWRHIERRYLVRAFVRKVNRKTGILKKINSPHLYDFCFFSKLQEEYWVSRINCQEYDIVVAVTPKMGIVLGRIAERLNCKTIGWQHSSFKAYICTRGIYFWAQDYLFQKYIGRLDHNVVLNDFDADLYEKELGIASRVIRNPRSFTSEEKAELLPERFIAVGNINSAKGYELLVESCEKFFKKCPGWKVHIFGDGPDKNKIQKLIEKANISDKLILNGYSYDIKKEMMASSALLLPSRWEGMPMVVVEAFEMGLPVIAYDITSVKSLIDNEKEGIIIPGYDTEQFADAMFRIAHDINLRKRMGQNAAIKAKEFDLGKIIEQWNSMFKE